MTTSFPRPVAPAGAAAEGALRPAAAKPASAQAFAESLKSLIESVEASSAEANGAVARMLDGTGDVHEAVIALQNAETALQLTVQIRNKLVQAYQDIMRMPV